MSPWNGPAPTTSWDVLQADGVLQFYPWRDLVFSAWGSGHLPLWNPYQLCGTPLLANSQSAGFYPLHIVLGLLHVPTPLAITLLAWFHLAWASIGTWALSRRLGATDQGAVFGGACYGLSSFMVSWTPLASVVTTCSWIPWILYFASKIVAPKPGSYSSILGRDMAGLAGTVAMMLLGGHLQFAAYGLMGLAAFSLVMAGLHPSRLGWKCGAVLGGVLLGGLLAAPQVLPVLAFSKDSPRQSKPTDEGAKAYGASALGAPDLAGFVVPAVTGLPGQLARIDDQNLPAYWPAYLRRGAAFAEGAIGIGPVAFLALFLGRKKRWRELSPAAGLGVLGFLLATGSLSILLYKFLPGWSATGSPGRAAILVVLACGVLAGNLWPQEGLKHEHRLTASVGAGLAILATIGLTLLSRGMKPWIPGMDSVAAIAEQNYQGSPVIVVLLLVLAASSLYLTGRSKAVGLALALVTTLACGPAQCLPSGRGPLDFPTDRSTGRVAFVNADWELLVAAPALMPGNSATTARIHDVAGYDSILSRETLELLRGIDGGQDPAPPANGNMLFVKPTFDVERLRDAGVTELWSTRPLPLEGQPEPMGGAYAYSIAGPGRFEASSGRVTVLSDSTDSQALAADGPGVLTVRDRNMPGWSATVDGRPAPIVNGLWRTISLQPGHHEVVLRYDPPGMRLGFMLFGIGLLATTLSCRRWGKSGGDPAAADS